MRITNFLNHKWVYVKQFRTSRHFYCCFSTIYFLLFPLENVLLRSIGVGSFYTHILDRVSVYRITHIFWSFLEDLIFNNVFLNTSIQFMYTPKLDDLFDYFLPITMLYPVQFSCQVDMKKVCKLNQGQNGCEYHTKTKR